MDALVPSSPLTWTGVEFGRWSSFIKNVVWSMPSGPVTPCLMATSRPVPVIASTTLPSQSMLMP